MPFLSGHKQMEEKMDNNISSTVIINTLRALGIGSRHLRAVSLLCPTPCTRIGARTETLSPLMQLYQSPPLFLIQPILHRIITRNSWKFTLSIRILPRKKKKLHCGGVMIQNKVMVLPGTHTKSPPFHLEKPIQIYLLRQRRMPEPGWRWQMLLSIAGDVNSSINHNVLSH